MGAGCVRCACAAAPWLSNSLRSRRTSTPLAGMCSGLARRRASMPCVHRTRCCGRCSTKRTRRNATLSRASTCVTHHHAAVLTSRAVGAWYPYHVCLHVCPPKRSLMCAAVCVRAVAATTHARHCAVPGRASCPHPPPRVARTTNRTGREARQCLPQQPHGEARAGADRVRGRGSEEHRQ